MFQEFLRENQTEYIYHTEVWWLSSGNVIERFVALRSEIWEFLQNDRKEKPELGNKDWLCDLTFLTNITGHLNHFSSQLQGKTQYCQGIPWKTVAVQDSSGERKLVTLPNMQGIVSCKWNDTQGTVWNIHGLCREAGVGIWRKVLSVKKKTSKSISYLLILFPCHLKMLNYIYNWN
jgi:hypothetical protein